MECACRKPGTGMMERAVRELNIDLSQSWMVGDTTVDVEMARRAGVRSILVRTGEAGGDGKFAARPEWVADSLAEAVDEILRDGLKGVGGGLIAASHSGDGRQR